MSIARWRTGRPLTIAAVALVLGTAAALLLAAPSAADEAVVPGSVEDVSCEPTSAELDDVAVIAEEEGIAMEEAVARFGWQGCFAEITSRFRAAYPGEFAGAAITDGGRGAWIAFKGDLPEVAAEAAERVPVPVQLIADRGFSEAELDEVLQQTYHDVLDHEEVGDAAGGYDLATGVVSVRAQPARLPVTPAERERLRELLQPPQPADSAVTVEVRVVDQLDAGPDAAPASRSRDVLTPERLAALVVVGLVALLGAFQARRGGGVEDRADEVT